MLTNTHQ